MRDYLARSTYVAAICSIGACLADGLQYAHDRDLVHMDVKPSNVLFADDGQPMLLDFHLARPPIAPGGPAPCAWAGRRNTCRPSSGWPSRPSAQAGRSRSASTAAPTSTRSASCSTRRSAANSPEAGTTSRPPLHRRNPQVSVGLSDIVQKCLRPTRAIAISDAAALAADLRRHVADLPLRGVPNRSPVERWRKWRRRTPHALSRNLILAAFLAAILAGGASLFVLYRQRVRDLEAALAEGRSYLDRRRYPEATRALRRGLGLAAFLPGVGRQRRELGRDLALASWNEKASELHRLAESHPAPLRPRPPAGGGSAGADPQGEGDLAGARSPCPPPGIPVDPGIERNVRIDMIDVLALWADLRVRLAPPEEAEAARREIGQVLAEAEEGLGPSPALERARREQARRPCRDDRRPGRRPAPRSAWRLP